MPNTAPRSNGFAWAIGFQFFIAFAGLNVVAIGLLSGGWIFVVLGGLLLLIAAGMLTYFFTTRAAPRKVQADSVTNK